MKTLATAALILLGTFSTAEARHRQAAPAHHPMCNITMPCDFSYGPAVFKEARRVARGERVVKAMGGFGSVRHHGDAIPEGRVRKALRRVEDGARRLADVAVTMLPHPEGCPRRQFCGCGAAAELGLRDRSLWLAANWLKFPRAAPAPGTAAARSGHVFVLKSHVEGNVWMVADYNSGGGMSRLHARSISGYAIVAPTGRLE